MNKTKIAIFTSIISIIFLITLVSAQPSFSGSFISDTIYQVIGLIQDILGPVFSVLIGTGSFDMYFFSRIMLLVIVFAVVYLSLSRIAIFHDNKGVCFVVAAAISLLGARYIADSDLIEGILLPYGTLTVALTILLPFLIYFFFVHTSVVSGVGRRLAWIVFIAVFFGLWWTRYDSMGTANWIYWVGILLVGVSLLFDKTIHAYFGISQLDEATRAQNAQRYSKLIAQLKEIEDALGNQATPGSVKIALERRKHHIQKQLHDLAKDF